MDINNHEELLFGSSSSSCCEFDQLDSQLLSQDVQDLDCEADHYLLDGLSSYSEYEHSDPAVLRPQSPLLLGNVARPSPTEALNKNLSRRTSSVINKIEEIFDGVCQGLNSGRSEVELVLSPCYSETDDGKDLRIAATSDGSCKIISFPGRNGEEAWRFAVVSRILELIHEALTTGITITKRDMYYRDPSLFGNQPVVDRYVDTIATSFRVSRAELNVCGAAKGLLTGNLTVTKRDGAIVDLSGDFDSVLTMDPDDIEAIEMAKIEWVLVIEKEASFQSLTASETWKTLREHGVAITGKGYPDLLTRSMLRFMTVPSSRNGFCEPQVYGLMDWDPDGIAILSVYKYGSTNKAMEMEDLLTPRIQRIGLSRTDIDDREETRYEQGLIPLTGRDRRKARQLLDKSLYDEGGAENGWRTELQIMLMLNTKAELQILDEVPGALHKTVKTLSPENA